MHLTKSIPSCYLYKIIVETSFLFHLNFFLLFVEDVAAVEEVKCVDIFLGKRSNIGYSILSTR